MTKLRDSGDDLFALVGATSEHLRIAQEFVEKDYWVTELLRSTAKSVDEAIVIFKGGSSLSKAFGLIERFSEDVDTLSFPTHPSGRDVCTRYSSTSAIALESIFVSIDADGNESEPWDHAFEATKGATIQQMELEALSH